MKKSWLILLATLLCAYSIMVAKPSYGIISDNSWVTRASMPTNSYGGQAVGVDGKIYVIGGYSGGLSYSANNVYDPSTDNWTSLTPIPKGSITDSLVAYQNKIYSIGANSTEVYDIATDSWEAKTPMPIGITGLANIVDGQIYVISGYDYPNANQLRGINEVYNIDNDSWTIKTSIPYPVSAYASTVCENRIYILGGQDPALGNSMNVNFTQIYDPLNDSWNIGAPMPTKVLGAKACATTGLMASKAVYLFGGYVDSDYSTPSASNLTQVYNPKNNSWSYGASMLSPRVDFALANVNDSLFVLGGSKAGLGAPYALNNEQYYPFGYGTSDLKPTSTQNSFVTQSWLPTLIIIVIIIAVTAISLLLYRNHRSTTKISEPKL